MSTPSLSITSGFATGAALAALPFVGTNVQVREAVDNSDSLQCSVVLTTVAIPGVAAVPFGVTSTVRLYGADGVQREYRVTSYNESADLRSAAITAQPPIADFALAGMVRADSNGETIFTFGGTLLVSQWLTTYVLTNLAIDGLSWLSATPGLIDVDASVTLQWSRYNRTQLLQAIVAEMEDAPEFYLSQSAPGAFYQLCVGWRNGALPALTVAPDLNTIKKARTFDDALLMTVVEPSGDTTATTEEAATIAEHAWHPTVLGGGWVQLASPDAGPPPIAFDDQFNTDQNYWLEVPNGAGFDYRPILDTDGTNSAVNLADASLMTDPACLVRIVRSNTGAPITQLPNPAGLTSYRRYVKPASFAGTRSERNWFPNPVGKLGALHWNATGTAYVESIPKAEVTDLIALANGAKATGGSASIDVDGVPPGTVFRRGTTFQVAATNEVLFVATTTTANGSGQATIPLVGANTIGTIPDNGTLTFFRNTFTWPTEGGAQMLRFQGNAPSHDLFTSDAFVVPLRGSAPRTAWARLEAVLWIPIQTTGISTTTNVLFEVTDNSGTVIVTQTAALSTPVQSVPRPVPLRFTINLQFPVNATGLRKLRLSSPLTGTAAPFYGLFVTGCSVYISTDNAIPLVDGSYANTLWQKGSRKLEEAHVTSPNVAAALIDLSQIPGAQLVADGLHVGQTVYVRDLGVRQRAVAITRNHLAPNSIDVQCAQLPLTLSGKLAAA